MAVEPAALRPRWTRPNRAPHEATRKTRVLLSGVFGPFGVDDAYGRKENIMELFHNQVTREQGIASFRFQHRSFGLYFLAENIQGDGEVEVTVLDFPSRARFEAEAAKGYDIVGISFIAPNVIKAREMARIVRERAPGSCIILGGHGAAVEDVATRIDCDHVVKGEGIRWLRRFLGQDPEAPIIHPALPSAERRVIFGVPVPGTPANLLVPGVGCVNACRFCCTSHFFQKAYTPFIESGRGLFQTACRLADAQGSDEFFVMDENFLKHKQRALDLIDEMEAHGRFFEFQIFSSAEAILDFGLDNLERLGVTYIWIGVESATEFGNFPKNQGVDPKALIRDLRARGIIVLASGILCQEHHSPANIEVDIDFMVGLDADFVQFMLLTPFPTTALYEAHKAQGLLRDDLPFEEWHGQKHLSYAHPDFPGDLPERWLREAFQRDYETNGSSMLRVLDTQWRGYQRLASLDSRAPWAVARRARLEERLVAWARILPVIARRAVNERERRRALALRRKLRRHFPPRLTDYAIELGALLSNRAWEIGLKLRPAGFQPAPLVTRYPAESSVEQTPCRSPRRDDTPALLVRGAEGQVS